MLDAEEGRWPREVGRIWVFPTEVPDGYWGGNGRVTHLAEILGRVTDPESARALADKRITASRAGRTVLPG